MKAPHVWYKIIILKDNSKLQTEIQWEKLQKLLGKNNTFHWEVQFKCWDIGHFQVQRSYMFNVYSQISKKLALWKLWKTGPLHFGYLAAWTLYLSLAPWDTDSKVTIRYCEQFKIQLERVKRTYTLNTSSRLPHTQITEPRPSNIKDITTLTETNRLQTLTLEQPAKDFKNITHWPLASRNQRKNSWITDCWWVLRSFHTEHKFPVM